MLKITRPYKGGHGEEADRLMTASCVCAEVEWDLPATEADEPMANAEAAAIAGGLLRQGHIAFRAETAEVVAAPDRFFPEPRLKWQARIAREIFSRESDATFAVAVTAQADEALAIFSFGGWSWGVQAVLAYDPAVADQAEIVRTLQHGLDWRNRRLPHGASLLFGTGHDGAFAIIAAATEAALAKFAHDCQDLAPGTILTGF